MSIILVVSCLVLVLIESDVLVDDTTVVVGLRNRLVILFVVLYMIVDSARSDLMANGWI